MSRFSRESSAEILSDFECGIQVMDEFIQGPLNVSLKNDPRYSFYVILDDDLGIVGMCVTSAGMFGTLSQVLKATTLFAGL